MDIDKEAIDLIKRWQPYMKVFGPHKGFPKNKISMVDDIAAFAKAVRKEALEECAAYCDKLNYGATAKEFRARATAEQEKP